MRTTRTNKLVVGFNADVKANEAQEKKHLFDVCLCLARSCLSVAHACLWWFVVRIISQINLEINWKQI